MVVDIKGRIQNLNLPKHRGLLPMFEAVVNSIQAFHAINPDSFIEVRIERDNTQTDMTDPRFIPPIQTFAVVDNAAGFTESNYRSFSTSDTTLKAELGGKGIGRFLWLKAYESVRVDSYYLEVDTPMQRHFDFCLSESAIENHQCIPDPSPRIQTSLRLQNVKPAYSGGLPKKAELVAQRLLEHCLSYFLTSSMPNITVVDEDGSSFHLNAAFNREVKDNITQHQFSIGRIPFALHLIKYRTTSDQLHSISYCAHSREVRKENLSAYIPLLTVRLREGDSEFVYLGYISGKYLDDSVNQERTNFTFEETNNPDDASFGQATLEFREEATIRQIREKCVLLIKENCAPYISGIRQEHHARVKAFVESQCPEYKHILKYRVSEIDDISPNSSEASLDLELHKLAYKVDAEVREKSRRILEKEPKTAAEIADYNAKYSSLVEQVTDTGMSNLAKYISHRKVILSLFEQRLKLDVADKYYLERAVHELFLPMRKDSTEIDFQKQNLWMIDERLSYHYYLSSDLPFSDMKPTDATSTDRPDIMIFNKSIAYVETEQPFGSIVIIEFKRPERTGYSDDENPITQVYSYMSQIEESKVKTEDGRTVIFRSGTPFYAYVICDITDKIKTFAKDAALQITPDQLGYFGFNLPRNAYVEIISYDKLLIDAKKRNKVLFDKLGLPPTVI